MEPSEIEKRRLALEDCVNVDENGVEFWYARDLQQMLGYTEWRNFEVAIKRAMLAAETSKAPDESHFVEVNKMVVPIVQQKIICYNLNYVYLSLVFAPHRSRTSLDKEYI